MGIQRKVNNERVLHLGTLESLQVDAVRTPEELPGSVKRGDTSISGAAQDRYAGLEAVTIRDV